MSHRHSDGYEMLVEAADLGFEYVELSHGITVALVPGIFKALSEGVIRVSSCHNFCPLPPHVTHAAPNIYQPSSPDGRELDMWVRHTLRSIDTTAQVEADRLVVHMGSVFSFWGDFSKKLRALGKQEKTAEALEQDEDFVRERERFRKKLRKKAPKHIDRIYSVLSQVAAHAKERNVLLCAENREGLLELPLDDQTAEFAERMQELEMIRLWHDAGHAMVKQRLGFLNHAEFMAQNHASIAGFHLHDTTALGKDHQAVGQGVIDFQMLSQYFRDDQVFVLELSPRLKQDEVLLSKARVEELFQPSIGCKAG